jgi:hypothetical protein
MLRPSRVCWAALCIASALPVLAQDDAASPLECEVNGYDLILRNGGENAIATGLAIAWTVRFSRSEGVHVLEKPFEPGARVYLTGALGASYLEPGTPCTVQFADPQPDIPQPEP